MSVYPGRIFFGKRTAGTGEALRLLTRGAGALTGTTTWIGLDNSRLIRPGAGACAEALDGVLATGWLSADRSCSTFGLTSDEGIRDNDTAAGAAEGVGADGIERLGVSPCVIDPLAGAARTSTGCLVCIVGLDLLGRFVSSRLVLDCCTLFPASYLMIRNT